MREIKSLGIDVSEWQGKIDWEQVKTSGIGFAVIRCGYGKDLPGQDDAFFARNAEECERLGIPYGVYLFSYATDAEAAKSEAAHVLRLLDGRKPRYPVFYDLEDGDTTGKQSNGRILEIAKAFAGALETAGYTVGIYANYYWNTTRLTDPWYDTKPRWIAQYSDINDYEGNYDIWQYSNTGAVPGVSGNCDMNRCYVDYSASDRPETGEEEFWVNVTLIRRGDTGSKVRAVQQLLIANGYPCGAYGDDGVFGSATENAVLLYQEDQGLDPDAIVGPQTLGRLLGY